MSLFNYVLPSISAKKEDKQGRKCNLTHIINVERDKMWTLSWLEVAMHQKAQSIRSFNCSFKYVGYE